MLCHLEVIIIVKTFTRFTTMRIITLEHIFYRFLSICAHILPCFMTHIGWVSMAKRGWRMKGREWDGRMVCERFWCHLSFCFMLLPWMPLNICVYLLFYFGKKWFINSRARKKRDEERRKNFIWKFECEIDECQLQKTCSLFMWIMARKISSFLSHRTLIFVCENCRKVWVTKTHCCIL